ncbi:hypothetical protein BH23ACT7_BH23ACT7_11130 [soil metagenome]
MVDVVVVGGGYNGLVCGCYLWSATAGRTGRAAARAVQARHGTPGRARRASESGPVG